MSGSPFFVVGCPRSGTSLLRDTLRAHPAISIPPESHFIPRLYSAWADPNSDREASALARRILSLQSVRKWELELEPSDFSSCRRFAEILDLLFGDFARREGKSRWGDKTPQYVGHIQLLNRLFPDARFIHIYRDGRDVVESWLRTGFTPGNAFRAARGWRAYVEAGRDGGSTLGDRYLEVRYETLVIQPEETMRGVCDFIGEAFTEAMLERPDNSALHRPYRTTQVAPGISRTKASAWKRGMPLRDRTIIESVAGELLAELDYELEGLGRPLSATRRSWWEASGATRSALTRLARRRPALREAALMARAEVEGRLRDQPDH